MLAADKVLLESTIRQSATSLKEKEFILHHGNLTTVGTQAAVIAGFTVTALIEFKPPSPTNRILKFLYYNTVILSLTANVLCIAKTTCLSVMSTSLAMRGPDDGMIRAVNGLYELREQVFALFGVGLMSLLFMAILGSWLLLEPIPAAVATAVIGFAIFQTYKSYHAISFIFFFREEEAVNFDDILSNIRRNNRIRQETSSSSSSSGDDDDDDEGVDEREEVLDDRMRKKSLSPPPRRPLTTAATRKAPTPLRTERRRRGGREEVKLEKDDEDGPTDEEDGLSKSKYSPRRH